MRREEETIGDHVSDGRRSVAREQSNRSPYRGPANATRAASAIHKAGAPPTGSTDVGSSFVLFLLFALLLLVVVTVAAFRR